jgi:hypothetical protein
MISILFSSYFHPFVSTFAFHTATTANMTLLMGQNTTNSDNKSLPFETVAEIYNYTNKALQALEVGNNSEVENQLNFTKEKLSLIISGNETGQQSQDSDTLQTGAMPEGAPNIEASSGAATESSEDTSAVETDAQSDNQRLIESETRERSGERRQVVP